MAERTLSVADWRGYGREQFPRGSWSVDGDVLRAVAQAERVDLITREPFGDFTLLFDWRLPRAGNTAVLYRVEEAAGPAAHTGPALQLLDDEHHTDGADALTSCGARSGLMARLTKGHIVLQHRGTEAWFRRLRIELTPA